MGIDDEKKEKEDEVTSFDDLLDQLEGSGRFQQRLLYLTVVPVFFIVPFVFLHQIYVLHVPDHWCAASPSLSASALNMSVEQWKELMLPKEIGPDLRERPSQCGMYDVNETTLDAFLQWSEEPGSEWVWGVSGCTWGFEYDVSAMASTAVSENNWVCELASRPTDLFTWGIVGMIVGAGLMSLLADYKGRRWPFVLSCVLVLIFMMASLWVSHVFALYAVFKFLAFASMMPIFQSPLNITTELSTTSKRGIVIGAACIAWSLGNMGMPLLAYLVNKWKLLRLLCLMPVLLFLFLARLLPESPRWLMGRGRVQEAADILAHVADINNVQCEGQELKSKLAMLAEESQKEVTLGYLSLFASSRLLAFRTLLVTMGFTASAFVYYQLMINIGNMAGNIFLNLFFLGVVEGPGCLLGVGLADRMGRRWTHFFFLALNATLFFILAFIVQERSLQTLIVVICMFIKMNISATFVLSYVQAMEIFPTCVRQSGIGLATLVSQIISIAGPYVVYLGATDLRLPYLVMCSVCTMGAAAVLHLPETLDAEMPESLAAAATFGLQDSFLSFKPYKKVKSDKSDKSEARVKMDPLQVERLVHHVQHDMAVSDQQA